jgi:hypothetical protein
VLLLQTNLSGAGDCAKTESWGSYWNWTRDWSQDWGKDFDLEWKENKAAADAMKPYVDDIEAAVRQAVAEATANCSAAAAVANASVAISGSGAASNVSGDASSSQQQQQQQGGAAVEGISDGSAATVDGVATRADAYNCTAAAVEAAAAAAANSSSSSSSSSATSTPLRRLAAAPTALLLPSPASSSILQHPKVASALAAAAAATSSNSSSANGQILLWKGATGAAAMNLPGQQQSVKSQLSFQNFGDVEGWAVGCWYCVGNNGEWWWPLPVASVYRGLPGETS